MPVGLGSSSEVFIDVNMSPFARSLRQLLPSTCVDATRRGVPPTKTESLAEGKHLEKCLLVTATAAVTLERVVET